MTVRCLTSSHVAWDGSALVLAQPCGCLVRLLLSDQQAEQVEAWIPKLSACPGRWQSAPRPCRVHGGKA